MPGPLAELTNLMMGDIDVKIKAAKIVLTSSIACSLIAPAAVLAYGEDFKSFRDISLTPASYKVGIAGGGWRADAEEVATLLNVRDLADRIREAKNSHAKPLSHSVEQARLLCLYRLLMASQEVRKAVANIDHELAESNVALGSLTAKRESARNMLTTLNFAQGGTLGIIKNSLSLPGHTVGVSARQEIAMTSFGTSIALSLTNMMLPSIWSRKIDSPPNSIAYIFDGSRTTGDASRSYLWKFMNSIIPGTSSGLTRKAILVKHFDTISHLDPDDETSHFKIAAVPGSSPAMDENIKVLNKRINLLHDMKTHIEEFDAALFEFHQAITID